MTDMVVMDIPTTDKDKLISPDICKKGQIYIMLKLSNAQIDFY